MEESLVDIQQQVEQAKAKLNQLLGAESVLKLVLQLQQEKELKEETELVKNSKVKNGSHTNNK